MSTQTVALPGSRSMSFGELLRRTHNLTANQRLLVVLYNDPELVGRNGVIEQSAKDLAGIVGWSPTMFSRIRQQLVDAGWLEQSGGRAQVKFFRLTPTAHGQTRALRLVD
ncbi:replication initiation protein, RepL2 [Kitasatospora sp. NPDC094028]